MAFPVPLVVAGAVAWGVASGEAEEPRTTQQPQMVRSVHQTGATPEASANCMTKNVATLGGPVVFVQPLYGMTRLAVVVRKSVTGDTLAVVHLQPDASGSDVRVFTTSYVEDREALVTALLKGC